MAGILGAAAGGWLESDQTFLAHVSTRFMSVGRAALVDTVATQSRTFQLGTGVGTADDGGEKSGKWNTSADFSPLLQITERAVIPRRN